MLVVGFLAVEIEEYGSVVWGLELWWGGDVYASFGMVVALRGEEVILVFFLLRFVLGLLGGFGGLRRVAMS